VKLFPHRLSRRHFLYGAGLAGFGYMRFVESQWLTVGRHALKLTKDVARSPLTILHLSDFHVSKVVGLDYVNRAVTRALAACRPDLVCLTGDFITSRWEEWDRYAGILARLAKTAPTVAVLGNHDAGSWAVDHVGGYEDQAPVATLLSSAGVTLLHNSQMLFEVRDWQADDAYAGADPAATTLLLSHNPDTKDALGDYRWDLMLCGHTHGGQLYLPGLGTPFASVRDHRYVAGLKPWKDRWIHVTKGIGNVHGMRFNCRPEISVLTLT
jgi:predicted MPP superfamily phosphohydrolase